MAISKDEARRLAINVTEMGGQVLRGTLTIGTDGAAVNQVDLLEWLAEHGNVEIMLIAVPMADSNSNSEMKTCQRCGRDYRGEVCPHCAEIRARLRG
jgi:hypothetical protein